MEKQPLFRTIGAVFKNPKLAILNEEEEKERELKWQARAYSVIYFIQ